MIGILSQNSFNDFNETNVGCLSGLNERNIILFDYIRFLHISTAPLPWNPPANDSCPEWSRGHPLLYWPRAPHHHPQFLQGCAPQDDDWLVWQLGPVCLHFFLPLYLPARFSTYADWLELFWRRWTYVCWGFVPDEKVERCQSTNDGGLVATGTGDQSRQDNGKIYSTITSPQQIYRTIHNFGI